MRLLPSGRGRSTCQPGTPRVAPGSSSAGPWDAPELVRHLARATVTVLSPAACLLVCATALGAQQVVDEDYRPRPRPPAYSTDGPEISIDASHHNPSIDGALAGLSRLLQADGYTIRELTHGIDSDALAHTAVLVIVDALADRNVDNWTLPTPSALDPETVRVVRDWVAGGGSLLLVADHMPFAGAASPMAAALGVQTLNGFAIDTASWDPVMFRRSDGTLSAHAISNGRDSLERVDSVFTYWGHALRPACGGQQTLMTFPRGIVSFQPREAWRFPDGTDAQDVEGWGEGLAGRMGRGRFVMLGDSGMLMAHLVGANQRPVGLNAPEASQNEQFMLNLFHWLSGLLS